MQRSVPGTGIHSNSIRQPGIFPATNVTNERMNEHFKAGRVAHGMYPVESREVTGIKIHLENEVRSSRVELIY